MDLAFLIKKNKEEWLNKLRVKLEQLGPGLSPPNPLMR